MTNDSLNHLGTTRRDPMPCDTRAEALAFAKVRNRDTWFVIGGKTARFYPNGKPRTVRGIKKANHPEVVGQPPRAHQILR